MVFYIIIKINIIKFHFDLIKSLLKIYFISLSKTIKGSKYLQNILITILFKLIQYNFAGYSGIGSLLYLLFVKMLGSDKIS